MTSQTAGINRPVESKDQCAADSVPLSFSRSPSQALPPSLSVSHSHSFTLLHRPALIMVDAFVGRWELKKSEKFDEYMAELGVNMILRTMGNKTKPTLIICQDGDEVQIKTESHFKTTNLKFKLGEEFDETTADGRKVKSVVTVEDGKLVHSQKWDGKETTLVREVEGDKLTLILTFGTVVSHRHYERSA
ncbi:hypothetical protein GJAV_G00096510 [Gymnothorax javanicus]|nr:hypothetical protein GJAV_G00096510 [Gymnothorax javanicus]